MCQLQGLDLWVLRGVVMQGGERCPGLFLYVRVEDYGDWITAWTQTDSLLPLSVFHRYYRYHHQEKEAPAQGPSTPTKGTRLQEPAKATIFMARSPWPENRSSEGAEPPGEGAEPPGKGAEPLGKGVRQLDSSPGEEGEEEEAQPSYYDYYSEQEAGQGGSKSGQSRLQQPQERLLLSSALAFFWNGRQPGS